LKLIFLSPVLALNWDRTLMEFKLPPGKAEQYGQFTCVNTSSKKVQINKVLANCECLNITSFPKEIEPGQTGNISYLYHAKGRHGIQSAHILVESTDAQTPQLLRLIFDLSPALTLSPGLLVWEKSRQNHSVQILIHDPDLKLSPDIQVTPGFTVKLQTLKKQVSYRLDITPPSGAKKLEGWAVLTFQGLEKTMTERKVRLVAN
jgi:Protein of unknown function (DUF1573)